MFYIIEYPNKFCVLPIIAYLNLIFFFWFTVSLFLNFIYTIFSSGKMISYSIKFKLLKKNLFLPNEFTFDICFQKLV